jgi:hypothetical protein
MQKILKHFLVIFALYLPTLAQAAVTPLSVAIVPPVQFPSNEYSVTGVRASLIYGHHRDLYGLDLGLAGNITDQTFTGIGISGLFNATNGTTTILGLQLAGITNINTNKTSVYGLQAALGMNYNPASSKVVGVQLAAVNQSAFTDIYGLQVGIYNRAKVVYGFQIGVVNITDNLHGIQIGLINFHHQGLINVSPIINVGF